MNNAYCYYLYSPSPTYGSSPRFIYVNDLPDQGFTSVYRITEETAQAIEQAGTAAKFAGVVYNERLWLDFDSYEAADRAELKLREMGYDFIAYDTGGRGAHFGILRNAVPSHLLPTQDKRWARANFPEADACLYTHLHPFRLPGTKHASTGRRKELVLEVKGHALVLPKWERSNDHVPTRGGDGSTTNLSGLGIYRIIANSKPFLHGARHDALVRLAYALKQDMGADPAFTSRWLEEVNQMFEEPKDEAEVLNIVRSIFD